MSPSKKEKDNDHHGFPRASGDEPLRLFTDEEFIQFSPRERG